MKALFRWMAIVALLLFGLFGAGCQGEQKLPEEQKGLSEGPRLSAWDLPLTDRPELVSDAIRPIFQDKSSALWFGTPGGVSRYDPATDTWTPYTVRDGLAGNYVYALLEDKSSALWVGTAGGVSRYDPETRTFSTFTTGDGLAEDHVLTIAEDVEGMLWFGTYKGASQYDPKARSFQTYTTKDGLAGDLVRVIRRDSSGALWFGTDGGASRYDPKTRLFQKYGTKDGLVAKDVVAIAEEPGAIMWFGTDEGASRYHPQTGAWVTHTTYSTKGGLVSNHIRTIAVDAGGALWFGTSGGVSQYDPKAGVWSTYSTKEGLLGNDIQSIVWDGGGIGWFGGTGGGVSRYNPKTRAWKTQQIAEGRPRDNVQAMARSDDGSFWLGVENRGVLRYDPRTHAWSRYTAADGLADNNVRVIAAGADGALWFGTNRGASVYDPKAPSFRTYTTKEGLAGNEVRAIAAGADGALWFGTSRGASRYDPRARSWSTYTAKAGLPADDIQSIAEGADGALWFGTYRGVSQRDPRTGSFRTYTTKDGLAGDLVRVIAEEPGAALWFGTDKGASRYDLKAGTWRKYTTKEGLISDEVLAIRQDRSGDVWFGTSRGASRYDSKTGSWTTYEPGLSLMIQAIAEDAVGTLWFGTNAGVARMARENASGEAGALLPTISTHPTFRAVALKDALVVTRHGGGLSFVYTGRQGPVQTTSLPVYPIGTEITALAPGPSGGVWVGTDFGGLLLRKPGNEALRKGGEDFQLTPRENLPSTTITALAPIAATNNEKVWVGTSAGACLVQIDDKGPRVVRKVFWEGMPTGPVDVLAAAPDGSAFLAYNALPRKRFSDPMLFERRARTRLFRLRAEGAPKEIRADDAFAKSEVRALAFSPKHGLWVGTDAGLFLAPGEAALDGGTYNEGSTVLEPVTAQGELSPISIRRLAIATDGSDAVWMGVDRQRDTLEIIGYLPRTGGVYKVAQERGVPKGDTIDALTFTDDGDLVVMVGPTLVRGRVTVPFLRPTAAAAPPQIWGMVALAAFAVLLAAAASAAVVVRRNLYLRMPVSELRLSAIPGTIRSMQTLRVLNASWDRLGLPRKRIGLLQILTAPGPPGPPKLRALAELLGMNNAATAHVETLPHGLTILSTKLPDPAPFREHPISLVAVDTTEARKFDPVHVRETLQAALEKAGKRFEHPYLLLAGGELGGNILPADLGGLRLGEDELKTLLFAKDPGHTLAGLLHARRLLTLSPYATAGDVKDEQMFFGRVALLKEILNSTSIQQLIIGPRRVGKTSLLKRLFREITARRPDAEPIFVDLYGIRGHTLAVRALSRTLKVTPPPDAAPDTAFVEILRARFQDSGKKGVVLIDEADGLIEEDASKGFPLFSAMRSLQAEEVCSFVLTGYLYLYRETLNQGSPLYNFARRRLLGPLDPEAARDLARVPMERLGVAYDTSDLPARIAAQTGGYPSFVQLLCDAELEVLRESGGGGLTLTEKHVEQAEARVGRSLGEIFMANAGKEAQIIVYSLLGREEFSATDAEQALERALGVEAKGGAVDRALQELRLFGFCAEEAGRFTWAIPLLRRTLLASEPEVAVKRLVEELSQS